MGSALGYIRRSRTFADRPGAVSHEAQTSAVRDLAARHGFEDLTVLEDWGRSAGAGKEARRTGYQTLRAAIKAGTVSDIFAYDQSRLTRSTIEWANLVGICREQHVRVHLVNGGTKDFDSVDGRMTAEILASVAQAERERGQERGAATVAYRLKRGDRLGPPRYGYRADGREGHEGEWVPAEGEDVGLVVETFRATGSYARTAKLLNERGVPSKRATRNDPRTGLPSIWRSLAVRRVIQREAPELIPAGDPRPGARTRQSYRFAGLLRCPCGATLTPFRRPGRGNISYKCQRAYTAAEHVRPASVPEHVLLPLIRAEVELINIGADRVGRAGQDAERGALTAQRERLALAFARGGLPAPTYEAEDAALAARLDALGDPAEVEDLGPLDDLWDFEPADANAVLRRLFERINLGPDMRPLPFPEGPIWRNSAWRAV